MKEEGGGSFKSFRDLARSLGSQPSEQPEVKESFTFERAEVGGPVEDLDQELQPSGGASFARERIARRPHAFGPMEHGPACYRDVDSEEMALLASFRVRTVFPDDVVAHALQLPEDPQASDLEGRVDLRGEVIFTIDGEDARDFDDAISIRALAEGAFEVGVHIADVGHYVRPGEPTDDEALARATSVYLPDQVVPMLPEKLSNNLCSLVPGRDRLTYSVSMTFNAKGARTDYRLHKSVIRSVRRNTYAEVQALLDGERKEIASDLLALEKPLRLFETWAKKQQSLRDARGSLRMQSRERKFLFDENHQVRAVIDAPRYFSMALIEETALAANQAVGDHFRARGLPIIYRVHPEKDPAEIEAVAALLEQHGIRVPVKERLTGRDIARMIVAARRRPNAEALIRRIMGLIERAVYAVHDHRDVARHFGLAREAYLHFTSPIRRYPDLMVHRWLHEIEVRGDLAEAELKAGAFVAELNDIAQHSSFSAELAEMAERSVGDLKVCQYMHPHIGEKMKAKLIAVSRAGLEVALEPYNVSGFLPARLLGERIEIKGPTLTARSGRTQRSFTEGYPIAVRLKDVDFMRLALMLEIA